MLLELIVNSYQKIVNFLAVILLITCIIIGGVIGNTFGGGISIIVGIILGGLAGILVDSIIFAPMVVVFLMYTEICELKTVLSKTNKTAGTNVSTSDYTAQTQNNSNDAWPCKKCGTRNPSNYSSCKDCGTYK